MIGLGELRRRRLAGNAVEALWPLARLTAVRRLDLAGGPGADLAPLVDVAALVWVEVSRRPVQGLLAHFLGVTGADDPNVGRRVYGNGRARGAGFVLRARWECA